MKRLSTSVNQIAIFERVIHALKAIETTPIATVSELRKTALSDLSLRTAQRYLKGLEQAGYIKRKDSGFTDELVKLESMGSKIVICKTCLIFYNLLDKVETGSVGTMLDIIDIQYNSTKLIKL